MVKIGENRVYDIKEILSLHNECVTMLDVGATSCEEWDVALTQIETLYSQASVKSHQMTSSLASVPNPLIPIDVRREKISISLILENMISCIPQQDEIGAIALSYVSDHVKETAKCIETLKEYISKEHVSKSMNAYSTSLFWAMSKDTGVKNENVKDYKINEEYIRNKTKDIDIDYEIIEVFQAMYGFTVEEAELLYSSIEKLGRSCPHEKNSDAYINYVYGTLSTLCINYDAMRWRMTTLAPDSERALKRLKKAGLSSQEILDLQVLINLQHGDFLDETLMEKGIDIKKSTFCNETHAAMMRRCVDPNNDFAHQTIQIAEFACEGYMFKEKKILICPWIIALFNSSDFEYSYTKYEISFKGDIDSNRYSEADFQSDVDAINIYNRMVNDGEASINKIWTEYYRDIEAKDTNRANEFLSNLGDGDVGRGILLLEDIVNKETFGSQYIQRGNSVSEDRVNKVKKIFMSWLLAEYYGYEYEFPE